MPEIRSFRDLNVYKLAVGEAKRVFALTQGFPKDERYSLTDQVRRSSRAVSAMVAEGRGRRRYATAFSNKINEALAECMEAQAWLDHALACNYIERANHRDCDAVWQSIGGMLNRMIDRAETFCRQGK